MRGGHRSCNATGAIQTRLLIFQTTPFCNMDCSYCYLPDRDLKRRIEPSIVSKAAQSIVDAGWAGDRISVVWHAGEPLIVGPDYLEQLIDACAPLHRATRVQHCVQTNAMLISERFCDVFSKRYVRVGVSIDGPRDLHDRHRVSRNGGGTFDRVMRGIETLREFGIAFDVICVVTYDSLQRAEELYEFFAQLGASTVGFNVDEVEGVNSSSSMSAPGFFEALSAFWECMLRLHFDRRAFRLREADDLLDGIRYGHSGMRSNLAKPFAIVTVAADGSVGTFSPELLGQRNQRYGNFAIGDIRSESLSRMAAGARFLAMKEEIDAGVQRCSQECSYFQVCGGGAPSNKIAEHGTFNVTETKYCRATKIVFFDSLLKAVKPYQAAVPTS